MLQMFGSHPPTSEAEIRQFEIEHGITLSDVYKRFLLLHNGGRPEPCVFPIKEPLYPEDTQGILGFFFCIGEDLYIALTEELEDYQFRIPKELLPIARDVGGNIICLCVQGDNLGKIYFWHHGFETDTPTYDNIALVADNFEAFINSLIPRDKLSED